MPALPTRSDIDSIRAGQAALWEAMLTLDQLHKRLPGNTPSIALVFTPAVMWSGLSPSPEGLRLRTHVAGPEPDDLIVITEPEVMQAWLNGKITTSQLFQHELIRLYGPEQLQQSPYAWV